MKLPNAEEALKLYYEKTEISNEDIKRLFNCNSTTAVRLKRQVKEEMVKSGIKTWRAKNVDVQTAYKVWQIDVEVLEKKLAKLASLKKVGVIKDE